jgi:hypothetical protein
MCATASGDAGLMAAVGVAPARGPDRDSMVGGLGVTAVGAVGDLPIAFSFRIAAGCLPGPAACCSTANDVGGAGQVSG